MKVTVIGTGYVGLVTGVLLSDFGNDVICVDNNKEKIDLLNRNSCPIYEPGLQEVLAKCREREKIEFTTNIESAIKKAEVIFIAVGTPADESGKANLSYVYNVTEMIGKYIDEYKVIVNKSTVPVGTGAETRKIIQEQLDLRECNDVTFDVVSNPEFLREGSAVYDFRHPDRIVLGTESEKALDIMKNVYKVLYRNNAPFVECEVATAEMIKYANNAFLATKITFMNEIANVCEKVGANVKKVAESLGKDGRISPKFLHAGPGYGGSCFPKDTTALIEIAKQHDERLQVVEAVVAANELQKFKMVDKIAKNMKNLEGKVIAILGITFKPETDDMREAPSLVIIKELVRLGAQIKIFDPEGEKEARYHFENLMHKIEFAKDEYSVLEDADGLVLLTEWNLFRNLNLDRVKDTMHGNHFFDLRNVYNREYLEEKGFQYYGIGV
ncbi:UDP-glucose dehydrogenase [Lachnospiraceae bacterium KM106-2]|nr:UDP-glucose dehydrogenase [Lachnospiraceae bacterium KM106-2]